MAIEEAGYGVATNEGERSRHPGRESVGPGILHPKADVSLRTDAWATFESVDTIRVSLII
jgi:hypothetical protein